MMKFTKWMTLAIFVFTAGFASAQIDPVGNIDTLTLIVESLDDNKWVISANLWNDEELAAMDIPISYTAGVAKLVVDSVSYAGTRIEYFAQKYTQVDTVGQVMHFGGLAYVGPDKPPLAPGNGEVGRIYISLVGDKKPGPFAVDTALYAPNNHLILVDRDAKTIVPVVKIETKKK